jgi:lipid II:glycine glycyltransferase (peptidoglycan interpeptide bridge formation enzyme)
VTAAGATATGAADRTSPLNTGGSRLVPAPAELQDDPAAWDAFVASAANGSFPQLTAWADANATKGWHARRVVAEGADGPVGAQLLIHRMRPGPWSRAYAPRGPVAAELGAASVRAFTAAVREVARETGLARVVIDPELDADGPGAGWLRDAGWRPQSAIQIDRTRLVDLRRGEAALWSDLGSSTRWSVNKARRSGLVVVEAGVDGLLDFERLYLATAQRVGFEPSAAFGAVYRAFASRGAARLLLCRGPGGDALAALVLLDCGDRVIELYGASSDEGGRLRANHLTKWEAIRASAARGMARYDMWGTDEAGVATFKAAFGGSERRYVGAWLLVTSAMGDLALTAVQRGRDLARRSARRATGRPGSV